MMATLRFSAKYHGKNYNVSIPFRGRKLLVDGDSGAGKTFICKLAAIYNAFNSGEILVYNYTDQEKLKTAIKDGKFLFKNKFVIIDNGEVLFESLQNLEQTINSDSDNFFLIFARMARGLAISPNYIGQLIFNDNTFTVKYEYREGVWG